VRILMGMPERGARGGPPACEPPFAAQLRAMGVAVEEEIYAYATTGSGLAGRAARVLRTARCFRERLRRGQFDIVHINTSFDTKALVRDNWVLGRLRGASAKIFLKFHGSDAWLLETRQPILRLLRNGLFERAAGVGVLSSEERANFLRAGVPEEKLFQVSNVVVTNRSEGREEFLRRWNLPGDRPLLLFIGRFIPAKGLLDTIRACQLLRERGWQFLLLCVGDGPARADAEAEVERLGMSDSVRFFGYVPEERAAGFYAHSTVLVFPTYHYEGFPLSVFHSVAAGLPIVTTRIRAAADYLKEPDNCLWVEREQPAQLAERIAEILHAPELRASMSANNRQLAQRFSAPAVAQEHLEISKRLARGS